MYTHNRQPRKSFIDRHRHLKWPIALVILFLLGGLVYFVVMGQLVRDEQPSEDGSSMQAEPKEEIEEEDAIEELPSVQAELETLLPTLRGDHAVLLEDPETGKVLASHRQDEAYFTASIYKLYVAYLGLIDIQNGEVDPDEVYNQGRTRQQCIVVMLRDSDSPCPEQMWEEQGRATGNERLADLGLTNTDLLAITTTVHDANTILKRLHAHDDLTNEHTELFREALRDYPEREFREGLPSASEVREDMVVYNKPGLYDEGWLDAAIIRLPNGREVVLSIFSDAAYHREVRAIADALIPPLLEE